MKKRYTIGFLVSGIMDEFTELMARGIMDAMGDDDSVRLVVVPVKYIDRDLTGLPDKYEYQYKTTSKFLTKKNMDALIVAKDCIGCLTTNDNIIRYMESLGDIPMVMIASRMEGHPGVTFDNRSGIVEGLNYLIEKLSIKKLCMLGGDDNNTDAGERKRIFIEVLKSHGLEYKDTQFVESELTNKCRAEAGRLLDQNPDAEAIFCVNDMVAMGLYEEMRDRGLEPGRDIKIMGFDNSVNSAMVNPSLSTVDANAEELGQYAYHMTMRMLAGEKLGEETIPTRFIKRDSFGMDMDSEEPVEEAVLDRDSLKDYFEGMFYRKGKEYDERLEDEFITFMGSLIDYISKGEHDAIKLREIRNDVESFLSQGALEHADIDELILYVDRFQKAALHNYSNPENRKSIYGFSNHIYKRLLKHFGNAMVQYEDSLYGMVYSMKTLVKDSLNFTYGNDRSYSTALGSLNLINIRNAYLYIYDKPILHLENEEFTLPETLRLKAAMNNGVVEDIPYNRQLIRLGRLFDNNYIKTKNYKMVLMPLYFGDTLYGVILYDLNDTTFMNGEFLANQFGTTARMIDILKMNNEIQKQLEENLAVMSQNNIELDKISKNDVLTGILNRRGFNKVAEEMLRQGKELKSDVILSYVDMNNLKIINDRFGHDDGDFALKTISKLLTEIIDCKGVVGRIGGDEYAFVYYGELFEDELSEVIRERFAAFNEASDKEYNITVSCGFFRVKPDEDISLDDAMAMADQDLYIAKQNKDNRILKEM